MFWKRVGSFRNDNFGVGDMIFIRNEVTDSGRLCVTFASD